MLTLQAGFRPSLALAQWEFRPFSLLKKFNHEDISALISGGRSLTQSSCLSVNWVTSYRTVLGWIIDWTVDPLNSGLDAFDSEPNVTMLSIMMSEV